MDTVDEDPNQEIGEYEENDTNAEGITQEYEDKNGNKNAIEVLEEDAILYIVVSEKEENIEIFSAKKRRKVELRLDGRRVTQKQLVTVR